MYLRSFDTENCITMAAENLALPLQEQINFLNILK